MYLIIKTSTFQKSVARLHNSGKFPDQKVRGVIKVLVRGGTLPAKCKDHKLKGYFEGYRECHVKHDFLLIYKIDEGENLLVLTDIGTHSQLFGT